MDKKIILNSFIILSGIFGFILPIILMENKIIGIALGFGLIFIAFTGFNFLNKNQHEEIEKNNYILYNA